jgi:membrane fusion protein, multidrug efflux system
LPSGAVIAEKANRFVFTLAENKARKTAIKTGFEDGENIEITGGLKESDMVLVPVKGALADGQPVKIVEPK